MAHTMNRRGFLSLLGRATAAGLALPTLEQLDYLARRPHSVYIPGTYVPTLAMDPEAVRLWSRSLMREALKQTWVTRYMVGDNPLIMVSHA